MKARIVREITIRLQFSCIYLKEFEEITLCDAVTILVARADEGSWSWLRVL
jgi:hypothetical protein